MPQSYVHEDGLVWLAERVAGKLVGIMAGEWAKWSDYVRQHGLRHALHFARAVAKSPSIHPGPRQSYRTVSQVIPLYLGVLESLSPEQLDRFLGYVYRAIVARRALILEEEDDV